MGPFPDINPLISRLVPIASRYSVDPVFGPPKSRFYPFFEDVSKRWSGPMKLAEIVKFDFFAFRTPNLGFHGG